MSFEILGIGTATPQNSIDQPDAATIAQTICGKNSDQTRLLTALYRRAGVRARHSVVLESSTNGARARQLFYAPAVSSDDRGPTTATRMRRYEDDAAPLANAAAMSALADAGLSAGEITHLVTVSCSGFSSPGFDVAMIRDLGLPADVARTHVGFMGCHGALNGLRVARAFTDADPNARALVCAVELCSLHQQYGWGPDRIVANALFADGAAAVVGANDVDRSAATWCLVASESMILPHSQDLMSWHIRDHGFEMTLSPRIPDLIQQHLCRWLHCWLAKYDLSIGDIGSWAVHPGGPRILTACAEAAGFAPALIEPSRQVLAEFGNMSSPTVIFILQRLRQNDAARPCVLLGFGPGLTAEAALILQSGVRTA